MSQASSVQTSVTIVTRDSNGQLSDYFTGVPGGVPVFQVAINQLGTGASIGGGLYTLTISPTDLPVTYAPEPSTLFLLLSGLAVSMLLYAKRFLAARN